MKIISNSKSSCEASNGQECSGVLEVRVQQCCCTGNLLGKKPIMGFMSIVFIEKEGCISPHSHT